METPLEEAQMHPAPLTKLWHPAYQNLSGRTPPHATHTLILLGCRLRSHAQVTHL